MAAKGITPLKKKLELLAEPIETAAVPADIVPAVVVVWVGLLYHCPGWAFVRPALLRRTIVLKAPATGVPTDIVREVVLNIPPSKELPSAVWLNCRFEPWSSLAKVTWLPVIEVCLKILIEV
jgi:hypothetical protein